MKLKFPSIKNVFTDFNSTWKRFPLILLSALIAVFIGMYMVENENSIVKMEIFTKTLLIFLLGIPLFFWIHLLLEQIKEKFSLKLTASALGVIFLLTYFIITPSDWKEKQIIVYILLNISFYLAFSFITIVNRTLSNYDLWQLIIIFVTRLFTTALYALIIYAGLALAVFAVLFLFDIKGQSKIYFHLWIVIIGVFAPAFFLARIPRKFKNLEKEQYYPKPLKILVEYILMPIITLYLLIIFSYIIRIILKWEWPKGTLSLLVLSFSFSGLFSVLLLSPFKELQNSFWIKKFSKWFYAALFPMAVLLILAVWRRTREYGITPNRYFIIILALWLIGISLYFLISKKKNIKWIFISLSLIALAVSFGPWSAFSISRFSQLKILENLLIKNELLYNNKLQKTKGEISLKTEGDISSILNYLETYDGLKVIKKWLPDDMMTLHKPEIMNLMGLKYRYYKPHGNNEYFYFSSNKNFVLKIRDYGYFFSFENKNEYTTTIFNKDRNKIEFDKSNLKFKIYKNGRQIGICSISDFILKLLSDNNNDHRSSYRMDAEKLTYTGETRDFRLKIHFNNINGSQLENREIKLNYINFDGFIDFK